MRILFFGNNLVGLEVLRWLVSQGENIVGLVVHPPEKQRYTKEMIQESGLESDRVFVGDQLRQQNTLENIKALEPDLGLSVLFDYILRDELISVFPQGCLNLHPAYLPYNRGQYPNVWSIVEGTPAGVTLHYIDSGVDTGDIVAQKMVTVEPVDTGETLYRKLEKASLDVFAETWPLVKAGQAPRITQEPVGGTYHRTRDVDSIDCIDLDQQYRAGELLDIIRARTFPPYSGAYFENNGERIYLRLQLLREKELEAESEDK